MKLARTAMTLLSVAVIAGTGWLLWSTVWPEDRPARTSREGSSSTEPPAATDRLDDMRWELAGLRGQVAAIQAESKARAKQKADERPSNENADESQHKVSPYSHLPPAQVDQAIADDLHTALVAEPVDYEWSKKTALLIQETIRDTGKAQLVNAECRSSLCRVEMIHQSRSEQEQELNRLSGKPPWNTDGFMHIIASNPPKSVVYFTRPGHQLPGPLNAN